MRKDIQPHYHPRSPGRMGDPSRCTKPHVHNCVICRHIERPAVERKVYDGWRFCDIIKAHPWVKRADRITDHFTCLGLTAKVEKAREINAKKVLEKVIRSGMPGLEEGKVYPRDVIEAVKALDTLEGKQKTEAIWDLVEKVAVVTRIKPKDDNSPDQTSRIKEETSDSPE